MNSLFLQKKRSIVKECKDEEKIQLSFWGAWRNWHIFWQIRRYRKLDRCYERISIHWDQIYILTFCKKLQFYGNSEEKIISVIQCTHLSWIPRSSCSHWVDKIQIFSRNRNYTSIQNSTKIITINGKVKTIKDSTIDVKNLKFDVIVQLLEVSSSGLSLSQHCEDHEYGHEWIDGQNSNHMNKWQKDYI